MIKIRMIWAQDLCGGISKNGKLPWNISEEMKHFKKTTNNGVVCMGRKTFESIGKLLPNRKNIIFTKNKNFKYEGSKIYFNFLDFLSDCEKNKYKNKKIWIIGGKEIYKLFLPYAHVLIISTINKKYNCDLFLNFSLDNFKCTETQKMNNFEIKKYILK